MPSTKLSIPHPLEEGCSLVGILEQVSGSAPAPGRKVALILHGTMGHKDYLFQKRLGAALPIDSFRFDFRGNHESGGQFKMGGVAEDVEDIQVAVDFLSEKYSYVVDLIVGHSRGSIAGSYWACTSPQGKLLSGFVNVSGRYRMMKVFEIIRDSDFDENGKREVTGVVARQPVRYIVSRKDYQDFGTWNTAIAAEQFPQHIDVLTIQGLGDKIVPPYDAVLWAQAYHNRHPGTHNLHYAEDADHNFTGRQDEVVGIILQWLEVKSSGNLRTGLWLPGTKGKL